MSTENRSILFLDKSFVKPKPEHLRGVEIFNISWIRDLIQADFKVTIFLESSWKECIEENFGEDGPECIWISHLKSDVVNTIKGALKVLGRKFDFLFLGNVGKGIVPGIYLLKFFNVFKQSLVIANREASKGFIKLCAKLDTIVLAVNEKIVKPFQKAGCSRAVVDYGIVDAERFHPSAGKKANGQVNFCIMGMLDNAWKGADTAINAFHELKADEKENFELHLASYSKPPKFSEADKIKAYSWFPAEEAADFLRNMDVLLVLSRDEHIMRETFSQVIVQGMLTGLPVIATGLPIFKEKLDEGGGEIIKNPTELKDAILKFGSDSRLRLSTGAKAREVALERYVWNTDRFVKRYL